MIIYSILAVIFGLCAATAQKRRFRYSSFTELFITFLVNGLLFPAVIGFSLAKVLKGDKVVIIPKI